MTVAIDLKSIFLRRPGIGAFLLRLLEDIQRLAPRHEFVLLGPAGALCKVPDGAGFKKHAVEIQEYLGKLKLPFYDQVQLPLALRKERVDLFFCPYVDAPLLSRKPLVITVHDLVLLRFPEIYPSHLRFYFNSLLRMHLRRACRVLTVSEFSKHELVDYLKVPPENIRVLPYALSEAFLRTVAPEEICAVRRQCGIGSEYLLYTGGVDPRKNLARLFQAIGRLNRNGPHRYSLVLTGDTKNFLPYRSQWEKEGLQRNVVLTGFLTEEQIAALYHGTALVIYPSLWEGFGLPVLEAIACGAPVVASRSSSIPEVGGDAAAYFDPHDLDEMVTVIHEVLSNSELRARLGDAARRRRDDFRSHHAAESLLAVFDEIAESQVQ